MMVVVGGLTRLTESGLSIVDWRPVTGVFPPVTTEGWQAELEKYRSSPEYTQKNYGMSIAEFKQIFWLEYLHRLLGRVIGLVFIVPLVFFAYKKMLDKHQILRLLGIFSLGGVQGFIGWWMVKSGLEDLPRVSHVRLTVHLGIAFTIFFLLLREVMMRTSGLSKTPSSLLFYRTTVALSILIFIQSLLGGLVAGNDAGMIHNTFPSMDGAFIPDSAFGLSPWWANFIDNSSMVQFQHRIGAYIVCIVKVVLWFLSRRESAALKTLANAIMGVMFLQVSLGIYTVIYQVPVWSASLHQAIALVMFALSLKIYFMLAKNKPTHGYSTLGCASA
jgi:cytochrome c oxidase assembly protein subunit 15